MSMVIYVGLDVHLNSIAAVWGKAKDKPRSLTVTPTEEGLRKLCREVGVGEIWGVYEASSCGFETYDRLRELGRVLAGEALLAELGEGIDVERVERLRLLHRHRTAAVHAARAGPDDSCVRFDGEIEQVPEGFDIVAQKAVWLTERRAIGGDHPGDGGLVEDHVEGAQRTHGFDVIVVAQREHVALEIDEISP